MAGAVETNNQTNRGEMNKLLKTLGYEKFLTEGPCDDDSCDPFQASGASCDAPSPLGNGPTAPSAVPRRGWRPFLAPMRGSAMLVCPRLANKSRVSGFRPYV